MIKIFRLHLHWTVLFLVLIDCTVLLTAISIGLSIRYPSSFHLIWPESHYVEQIIIFVTACLLSLFMFGVYRRQIFLNAVRSSIVICLAHFSAFLMLTLIFYVFQETRIWLGTLIPSMLIGLALTLITHRCFDRYIAFKRFTEKVLVLGAGQGASRIARMITAGRAPMISILGYVPSERVCPPD